MAKKTKSSSKKTKSSKATKKPAFVIAFCPKCGKRKRGKNPADAKMNVKSHMKAKHGKKKAKAKK